MSKKRIPESYFRKVRTASRLPVNQGYYKVSFFRTNMIVDQLFIKDEPSINHWRSSIEYWIEEIPEPFAITYTEAMDKMIQSNDFLKMILECNNVGAGKKDQAVTAQQIQYLKTALALLIKS